MKFGTESTEPVLEPCAHRPPPRFFQVRALRGRGGEREGFQTGGYLIIECLVYGMVLLILLGVAYAAFYRCVENSVRLRRNADDVANALHAGERWRADVRAASGSIRFESTDAGQILRLTGVRGEVAYQFTTNAVLRRVGNGTWTCMLNSVQSSAMESDPRPRVTAWRWELELKPRSKKQGRVRPLFTFLAVPERSSAP